MIGFMDESLRRGLAGLYLVAVVVVADDDLDDMRHRARSVLRPRQPRFHWRNEGEATRKAMLTRLVCNGPGLVLAYACRPLPKRHERARALCLERVTWDLKHNGTDHLVIESRERRNDTKDAATIERARRAGKASPALAYTFERPNKEPLLWLADAACGAISAHLAEDDSTYVDQLPAGLVTVVTIDP
jgi:hypothetical protein